MELTLDHIYIKKKKVVINQIAPYLLNVKISLLVLLLIKQLIKTNQLIIIYQNQQIIQ